MTIFKIFFSGCCAGPHGGAGAGPLRGHEGSEDGSGRQRRRRLMLVTRCTFSLRSHRTAYFSQALLRYDHKHFHLNEPVFIYFDSEKHLLRVEPCSIFYDYPKLKTSIHMKIEAELIEVWKAAKYVLVENRD